MKKLLIFILFPLVIGTIAYAIVWLGELLFVRLQLSNPALPLAKYVFAVLGILGGLYSLITHSRK